MSLLLDALKKAALDKRQHDLHKSAGFEELCPEQAGHEDVCPEKASPVSESQEETTQQQTKDAESLTFEIEFPDEEVHTSVVEMSNENLADPVPVNVPPELQQPLQELSNSTGMGEKIEASEPLLEERLAPDSVEYNDHEDEDSNHLVEAYAGDNDDIQNQSSPEYIDEQPVEEAVTHRAESVKTEDSTLSLMNADNSAPQESDREHQSRKAALSQLLKRSQATAKRNQRRKLILLGGLLLTSVAIVALYYYYLMPVDNYQAPMMASSSSYQDTQQYADQAYDEMQTGVTDEEALAEENLLNDDNTELTSTAAVTTPEMPVSDAVQTSNVLVQGKNEETVRSVEKNSPTSTTTEPVNTTAKKGTPENQLNQQVARVQPAVIQTREATPNAHSNNITSSNASPNNATQQESNRIQINANAPSQFGLAIRQGYTAYQEGRFYEAEQAYKEAMQLKPHHRDALLGAAAVAFQQGKSQQALSYYQQRLSRAPTDSYAKSGIIAIASAGLPASPQSNTALESEVNKLLTEFPEAAHLHFLKGSIHAARMQWGSAQLSFFEAWRWDKTKPDYVYNLAVSLDHLNQSKEALRLYRQAIVLSAIAVSSFNNQQASQRILQLEQQLQQQSIDQNRGDRR